jgi:hypothetical protein
LNKKLKDTIEKISKDKNIDLSLNKKGYLLMPWPTRKNEAISEFTTRNFSLWHSHSYFLLLLQILILFVYEHANQ